MKRTFAQEGLFAPLARVRGKSVLFLTAGLLLSYGGARIASGAMRWTGVIGQGTAPRIQAGTVGAVTVRKPSGIATFNVTFPQPFKTPPVVVLTLDGDTGNPIVCRLSRPAAPTGFQGVAQAVFFLRETTASTVSVNWVAYGE
jgi:hypothetical protein